MIGPFVEAIRATPQPCTFLLVVPISIAVIVTRARWQAFAAVCGSAVVGGWLLAANWFLLDGVFLRVSGVVVIVALAVVAVPAVRARVEITARADVQVAISAAVALIATQWWRPCVGDELGTILTGAQFDLAGQLFPMSAYMLGAMVPVGLIVLAWRVLTPSDRVIRPLVYGASAAGFVIAASIVAGQHDDVVVTLTRWTLS